MKLNGFIFWDGTHDVFVATSRTRKTARLLQDIRHITGATTLRADQLQRATYEVRRMPSGRELVVVVTDHSNVCDLAINGSIVLIHLDEEGGDES